MNNKQNGIAIIGVLVIVALISFAITFLIQQQSLLFNSTKLSLEQDKINNYFYDVQSLAKTALIKNFKDKKKKYDSKNETWATPVNFPIKGGYIQAQLIDRTSKLNIHQIFTIKNNNVRIKNSPNFNGCLLKLTQQLEIPRIDDQIIAYLRTQDIVKLPIYLSGLALMIDGKSYQKIKPFVYVNINPQKININTASKEIIMCLHPEIDEFIAKNIEKYIDENKGIKDNNTLKNLLNTELSGLSLKEIERDIMPMLDVKSYYYELQATIKIGDNLVKASSVLLYNDGKIKSYFRNFDYKL